jgi:SAM-dependent methyltransferase
MDRAGDAVSLRRALRPLMRPEIRAVPPVRAAWRGLARRDELAFWRSRPGLVADSNREWVYTSCFDVAREWYAGKRILDVGCGPRGSLDWATDAAERIGLDPLAHRYLELGVDPGAMEYVKGVAERMPFADASFDVVSSINSLDHVDDVRRAASEILRVLAPGGLVLVATELNHRARLTEPQTFGWDVLELLSPPLELLKELRLADSGSGMDETLARPAPYRNGEGVLVAKLRAPIALEPMDRAPSPGRPGTRARPRA